MYGWTIPKLVPNELELKDNHTMVSAHPSACPIITPVSIEKTPICLIQYLFGGIIYLNNKYVVYIKIKTY